MSIFIGCLYVVEVLVCLMLALVVMLQKPKEGGLGGAIGGGMLEASVAEQAAPALPMAAPELPAAPAPAAPAPAPAATPAPAAPAPAAK